MRRVAFALLLLASVAHAQDTRTFREFGGHDGVERITVDLVDRLVKDPRIKHIFDHADLERFTHQLTKQLCELTGGPFRYQGRSMKEVHSGMGLRTADFNALVEDLQDAMEKFRVPNRAQNKLLSKLAPMFHGIVER